MRGMREVRGWRAAALIGAAMTAGCGATGATSAPLRPPTPSPTPTPTPPATPTLTPSGPQLDITQFGVSINLTGDLGYVSYAIDSVGQSYTDAQGNRLTLAENVIVWPDSLAADPACAGVEQDGLVVIAVFTGAGDPAELALAGGPADFKEIGQYWFGISASPGPLCSDGNSQESQLRSSLMQAYATLHPDSG